jgi:lysophospholipase L1-like esterase
MANHDPTPARRRWFWLALVSVVALVAATMAGLWIALRGPPRYAGYLRQTIGITRDERMALFASLAERVVGIYDAIPDSDVGRILQRDIRKTEARATIAGNNVGMRSTRPYGAKNPAVFRIVCLGDSFTFGYGGAEEDRYGDQLEARLRELVGRVEGKTIEVYSIGIGSWTALNEATYLSARISEYDPDIVLTLTVSNDIGDTQGVMGVGASTNAFSPEQRALGSSVFHTGLAQEFGAHTVNLLAYDLGPESRRRWDKAFAAWKRLEDLQHARGKRILFGVLDENPYFSQLVLFYAKAHALTSPIAFLSYFPSADTTLAHDPHPNRRGHEHLANQYLHALAGLAWLPIAREARLPPLPKGFEVLRGGEGDPQALRGLRHWVATTSLREELRFDDLDEISIAALLGGILPDRSAAAPMHVTPFGTRKTTFLLKRVRPGNTVAVEIEVPPRPELYPMDVRLYLHGREVTSVHFADTASAGRHTLEGAVPTLDDAEEAIEVTLRTDSYWSRLEDDAMLSYRLIAARVR